MRDFAKKSMATRQRPAADHIMSARTGLKRGDQVDPYLYLQRTIGNQAVQRLAEDRSGEDEAGSVATTSTRFAHDFSRIPLHNNAEKAAALSAEGKIAPHATPQAAEVEADQIAKRVAVPEGAPEGALPTGLAERLGHEVGGDFSRVRVHSDAAAADRVAHYGAEAMSEGRDLFFAVGRWQPETREGAFLAAHEAVHAAQLGFVERHVARSEARYLKKDPPAKADRPPNADPRDVFDEIKKRAPDLAVFVDVKTISAAMAGHADVEGPAVSGGTSGTDVHEWHVSITVSPTTPYSQTASKPIVTTKKMKSRQLVKHVISIVWGTFAPLGSYKYYDPQAEEAKKTKALPAHAARPQDFAFELRETEPLIHELLHARVIMETDPTFTVGPHTQLVQGYLDMIAASQSTGVKKQRDAVRAQIAVAAGMLTDRQPTAAELADVVDKNDEFLVHEKFDSQKVFRLMGRSGAANKDVAEAYSKVVVNKLKIQFGKGSIPDREALNQLRKLIDVTTDYYNAIDTALAAVQTAPQPSSAPGTVSKPAAAMPASPPKK